MHSCCSAGRDAAPAVVDAGIVVLVVLVVFVFLLLLLFLSFLLCSCCYSCFCCCCRRRFCCFCCWPLLLLLVASSSSGMHRRRGLRDERIPLSAGIAAASNKRRSLAPFTSSPALQFAPPQWRGAFNTACKLRRCLRCCKAPNMMYLLLTTQCSSMVVRIGSAKLRRRMGHWGLNPGPPAR